MNLRPRPAILGIVMLAAIALIASLLYVVHMQQLSTSPEVPPPTSTNQNVAPPQTETPGAPATATPTVASDTTMAILKLGEVTVSYPVKPGAVWFFDSSGVYAYQSLFESTISCSKLPRRQG
jgi:hypothetical protein